MILHDKKILAVASDFDGTIIKEGMTSPPDSFFQVVENLLDQGIPFIAASGRQYANLRRMLHPIADRIQYIAENGCLVLYQGRIVHKSPIAHSLATELLEDMKKYSGAEILVSGENTSYIVTKNMEYMDKLENYYHNNVTLLQDFSQIPEDMIKLSIYWKEGIPAGPKKAFHEKYDSRLHVADGGNGWLDFNALGTGKGEALRVLAGHMGIPTSQIVVFGDNENDLTMLKEAGLSYAVASARPPIQAVADYVCDNVEDVLKEALNAAVY